MVSWNKPSYSNPVATPKTNRENKFSINIKLNNDPLSQPLIGNITKNFGVAGSNGIDIIFRKENKEKDIKINLFIIEGQVGFEKLSVR